MDLELTDWITFLDMLSVERTRHFISELRLPFGQELFSQAMRMARACLEVHMFPSIRKPEGHVDSPDLVEAWIHYRKVEGVLSDETLCEFTKRYTNQSEYLIHQGIYSELQHWIGSETANALKEWFIENYRPYPDPVWRWPWALRMLFTEPLEGVSPTTPAPISDNERRYIEDFCIRYRTEQLALEMRFHRTIEAAKAEGPTEWERVLQTYPADGIGNSYPWLSSVGECLRLRLIRQEWDKLRKELGAGTMEHLTKWVRQQAGVLPFNTSLPEEPEPLYK